MSSPTAPPPSGPPPSGPPPSPSLQPPGSPRTRPAPGARREALRRFLDSTLWARLRTALTLLVLLAVLLVAARWAFDAVSEPFPDVATDDPVCEDTEIVAGDVLRPAGMTVSVINAGDRSGLAGDTLDNLQDQGFARGRLANAPERENGRGRIRIQTAQLWTTETSSPAVRLLSTYLGGNVTVVERESPVEGLTLVVGDQFPGVREGRPELIVRQDSTVCAPVDLQ